ncbi:hypothetical protein [Limnobacter parvus]|uniref:Uncharacterized protein n=1 Tax=Limnobacter parvus TaxID=2939690 RepID=A0ABT1XJI9_9BURK|nr:hypothetical protein [Limnobacter parvus]MCR2747456.1 hypothetical protein [Limnobacter parvus]
MKLSQVFTAVTIATATVLLAACLSDNSSTAASVAAAPSGTENVLSSESLRQVMGAESPLGLGCGWLAASDPDKANIAFPDSEAKYWVAAAPVSPQTRLRIDGRYPDARYFSYNAYDPALRPTDALADFELAPNDPKHPDGNPFVRNGAKPGGNYTAYLEYGPSPVQNPDVVRKANTFYTGDIALGPLNIPNALAVFMYRVYVSNAGEFFDGGVGLPTLTLETADGSRELGTLPNCAEPLLPNLGGALPPLGLNELLLGLDYPNQLALPFPTATQPPSSVKFFSLGDTAFRILGNVTGQDTSMAGNRVDSGSGGFLSNIHNAYTTTAFDRSGGSIALVRGKAPTYRGQAGVAFNEEQLRYWSLCANEFATQRFTDCAADFQVPLDDQGYFTVVISDPVDRPANATAENGFLWLPWGPYPDQLLIYRHMLHNPDFGEAIQNVEKGDELGQTMKDFAPVGIYCDPSVFTQSMRSGEVFALCEQDQNTRR